MSADTIRTLIIASAGLGCVAGLVLGVIIGVTIL